MRRASALVSVLLLAVLAFWSPAWADSVLIVDDDTADCPNADFSSIQAAVTAAQPGDTIQVCPGTYNEEVMIETDDLRLEGERDLGVVVLDGNNLLMHGFELHDVSGVVIDGFDVREYHDDIVLDNADGNTIQHNRTYLASGHDGIILQNDSDGNAIVDNVSFDNTQTISCGISVGGGSGDNLVAYNLTFGNPNTGILLGGGILGPAGLGNRIVHNVSRDNPGHGIFNASSPGALIAYNLVQHNQKHGIFVSGAASTGVTISHNAAVENGIGPFGFDWDGINLTGASANLVAHNDVRLNAHDGIRTSGASNNVIEFNVADDNGTPAVKNGCGVDLAAGSTGNVVRGNVARNHDRAGIRIINSGPNNLVQGNDALDNPGHGIQLVNGDGNAIEGNRSHRNGSDPTTHGDGIRADSASTGNVLERNLMFQNAEHDAHDDDANTWNDNHCRTDFPAGTIC